MKKYFFYSLTFFFGILVAILVRKAWESDPHDLGVYRGKNFEIWIQNMPTTPWMPMSHFYSEVKYRKLCQESGNICSDWKTVAKPELDAPYRFNEIEFSQIGDRGFKIKLPEGFIVSTSDGETWQTDRLTVW